MCTVTTIPLPAGGPGRRVAGCRVVCNRDESRTRPAARPPERRRFGSRVAVLPVDPASDGTWIAVNDAGLALVLLNVNPPSPAPRPAGARSRGMIIPALLHLDRPTDVLRRVLALTASDFGPFRLIILAAGGGIEVVSTGDALHTGRRWTADQPMFFTSSGLGDHVVARPRRQAFHAALLHDQLSPQRQDDLHNLHWPARPALSVRMARPDARTVSRTTVELHPDRAVLRYMPLDEDGQPGGPMTTLTLPIVGPPTRQAVSAGTPRPEPHG